MAQQKKVRPPTGIDSLERDAAAKDLIEACCRVGKYQPYEMLRWLVDDILGSLGVRWREPPPEDTFDWLREHSGRFADLVVRFPFQDVLGFVYQELGSRGQRKALGQFFTPPAFAELVASVTAPSLEELPKERLARACEPACGSGAMILAFLGTQIATHGADVLRCWSVTAIDLDPMCARMCAAQVLSNLLLQGLELGELVIYRGNALGRWTELEVVVHATTRDLTADVVLPALHPSRLAALRDTARLRSQQHEQGGERGGVHEGVHEGEREHGHDPAEQPLAWSPDRVGPGAGEGSTTLGATPREATATVDLFAD